jgi:hypothetical protein
MQYNNVCVAENEEALPKGWDPIHVQMGFKPKDSVITVGIGWTYISSVVMAERDNPAHMVMADQMKALLGMGSMATIIMDPSVAALLKDSQGFETKDQLSKWFSENVEKSIAGQKTKPFNQPSGIRILVTGGGIQTTWFVTDFMLGPGSMLGKGIRIDDWR